MRGCVLKWMAFILSAFPLGSLGAEKPLDQAWHLWKIGQIDQAAQVYLEVIRKEPTSAQAFQAQKQLALLYIKAKRFDQAQAATQTLLTDFKDQNDIADAAYEVAQAYHQAGLPDKAEQLNDYLQGHGANPDRLFWARAGQIRVAIARGEDQAAQTGIDSLISDYRDRPELAQCVFESLL